MHENVDEENVSIQLGLWHLFLDLVEAPTVSEAEDPKMEMMLALLITILIEVFYLSGFTIFVLVPAAVQYTFNNDH